MPSEVPLLRAIVIKLGGVDVGGSEVPAYKAIVQALGGTPAFSSEVPLLRQIVKLSGGAGNGATEVPLMREWAKAIGVANPAGSEVFILEQILEKVSAPEPPSPPIISGIARPGNTLTSTKAGQWYLDTGLGPVAISGQTGSSILIPYTVAPTNVYTQMGSNSIAVVAYDADAKTDIDAVIAASSDWGDTTDRRNWNKWLYSDLISDMKTAGVYTAAEFRKCLMGPTTLAGVAACGVGGTITNNGPFVAGDLSSLGTKGNGASKYWASNRAGNANAQDDFSWWVWVTAPCTTGDTALRSFFGQSTTTSAGSVRVSKSAALNVVVARGKNATDDTSSVSASDAIGLVGLSRNNSASYLLRIGGITETIVKVSDGNLSTVMQFLARAGTNFSDARIGFLGGGASLSLPALETCLQNYQTRRALVP